MRPQLFLPNFALSLLSFYSAVYLLPSVAPLSVPSALAQTPPDPRPFQADLLLRLGMKQHQTGQFQEALKSLQEALRLYRAIDDRRGEANALFSLGETHFTLGQYLTAIQFYRQTLEIRQATGDRPGEAKVLDSLGSAFLYLGEDKVAQQLRQSAETVRREIGNPQGEAAFLGNVGIDYESQSKYPQAIEFYQQQLAIARTNRDVNGTTIALNHLAAAYCQLGQYPQAIEFYQQQLALARKTGDTAGEAVFLNSLAEVYTAQGQYQQAIELYQQQLVLARKTKDTAGELNVINNLAAAYRQLGQYPQAIELYQQPLAIARSQGDRLAEGKALNNLGFALLKSAKLPEAKKTLLETTQVWQAIRSQVGSSKNYVQEQATTYRLLQQVLIAQNQPEAALEMSEQGRSWSILALLNRRLVSEPVGSGLKAAPPQIAPLAIAQIRQIAAEHKATLVEYSLISEEGLYVWVVQPTGEVTFRRIDPQTINTLYPVTSLSDVVASVAPSLGVNGKSDQAMTAKPLFQLHQILIKPIADLLPKDPNARVIFIPQKELLLVPFPALVDITNKYLIEKHTILTAPAIQLLALTRKQKRDFSRDNALVVGNPTMPSIAPTVGAPPQPLPPLVSAEQEALEVAELLKAKPLTGNQATKNAVLELLPKARVVHLATYGLLDDLSRQGIPGAIAIAPGGNDNGLLTAGEILDRYGQPEGKPLRASLVVISSGYTGKSKVTGDGVVGLAASLMSVGVPSVVVSLWSAPDAPTTSLMTEFYKQLKQNPDKAQALRQAMLTTLKQNPNPRDWAGFTLMGEPQ